ncbi:MAG TPA: hypothetical protein VF251_02920 [Pyrinomonadaceae bacterium]
MDVEINGYRMHYELYGAPIWRAIVVATWMERWRSGLEIHF